MANLVRTPDGRVWSVGRDYAIGRDRRNQYFGSDYRIGADGRMYFAGEMPPDAGAQHLAEAALAAEAGGFSASEKEAQWGGKLPLPLGPVTVGASGTATINAQPQNAIKVQELVVFSGNASLFDILEVSVGTENQFVQSGAINGDIFSSASQRDVALRGSTANPGNIITVRVQNLDTVNGQIFRGAIIGPVIRSYG